MLTDRGKGVLVAAVGTWVASRLFGVTELAMAATGMVALVAFAALYAAVASATLSVRRSVHPARLFFDTSAAVLIRLTNDGRLPTALLQVEDEVPAALSDPPRSLVSPVAPGATVTIRYDLHGRQRGRYVLGPVTVRLRDPFGLVARTQRFADRDEVTVYPLVWQLPSGLPLGGDQGPGGEGRPRPSATGEELATIREYVRGDDLRKVHWRSTAHRGKLMVRQDESPRNPRATVVLDVRRAAHAGFGAASSFETSVSAAASVTYHLAERSFAVSLVTQPATTAPRALPWDLVLEQLAVVEPEDADLGGLWQQIGHGGGTGGVLAAVVTVPDPDLLRAMVRAGRGATTRVAVLVDAQRFASRRRRVDVAPVAAALEVAGWRVTVLGPGDPFDARWRELITARPAAVTALTGDRR